MIKAERLKKGSNGVCETSELDLHIMSSLEFGDFTQALIRHNLDDNQEYLLLCKLEDNQLLWDTSSDRSMPNIRIL
jgi:hypothetical protein